MMNPNFDPSKMDPKLLMELSQLVQQLPPQQLAKMQTMMHNAMAGYDTRKEMEEFEKSLPPGFREKILTLFAGSGYTPEMMGTGTGATAAGAAAPVIEAESTNLTPPAESASAEMNLREARLTILRAVAAGNMAPEEAEKLLFTA